MTVETAVVATAIVVAICAARHGRRMVAGVWRDATRLEKLGLCLFFVPIPGPVDEIIAALVVARILARRRRDA